LWRISERKASTGPRSGERGKASSITRSGAGSQHFDCDCLHRFGCSFAHLLESAHHKLLVLKCLHHASARGVFRITAPLAG